MRDGARGSAAIASWAPVPDYDPLTISDEELKKLTPAERGAVYKARAAARAGGAAAPPSSTAASAAPASAPQPSPKKEESSQESLATPAAAAPAEPAPAPAAPTAQPAPAAPAPKPEPPKEPEKPKEPAFVQHVLEAIPGASWQFRHGYAEMKVPSDNLLEAATILRREGFDYLSFISEVDWQDRLELVYHLFAYDYRAQPMGAILRCDLPREGMPAVASLTGVWPGAEFMERECFEMMGIRFLGHPDLRKILLPDDFVGFPMRRDYETDYDYITVKQLVHESD
jgi:NADH-quinone oxidoreductase subunit C